MRSRFKNTKLSLIVLTISALALKTIEHQSIGLFTSILPYLYIQVIFYKSVLFHVSVSMETIGLLLQINSFTTDAQRIDLSTHTDKLLLDRLIQLRVQVHTLLAGPVQMAVMSLVLQGLRSTGAAADRGGSVVELRTGAQA